MLKFLHITFFVTFMAVLQGMVVVSASADQGNALTLISLGAFGVVTYGYRLVAAIIRPKVEVAGSQVAIAGASVASLVLGIVRLLTL